MLQKPLDNHEFVRLALQELIELLPKLEIVYSVTDATDGQ